MGLAGESGRYLLENHDRFLAATALHLQLSVVALVIGIAISVPTGIAVSRSDRIGPMLVAMLGGIRVVPSLAVLFLLLPYLGTGFVPALVALTFLAVPPIVVNTEAGLRGVDAAIVENARGLGMNAAQLLARVQWPMALPLVVAGVRTATVEVIASATLAAFIGAGGLGEFILAGMTLLDYRLLLVGAVPVTLLAIAAEGCLHWLERAVAPPVPK